MQYERRETLLSVKDVSLKLGGTQILRDVNFEIKDIVRPDCITGQIVALIGQSGAGKSTLFSLMAGLRTPDTGQILQGPHQLPVQVGCMGVVYQNYYMFGWRKIRNLLISAAEKNPAIAKNDVKDAVEGIANDFNIYAHLDKYPSKLSGGQQQRAAIAEQVMAGSEFILLDEPLSGLDMIMIEKVMIILQKVASYDEEKTLILVSHDISNAIAIADTVFILAKQPNLEGGTIVKEINLIERGLTWHADVKELPEFRATLKEIKGLL